MSLGLAFWILMLVWLVFGIINWSWPDRVGSYGTIGNSLFLFILFGLIGWAEFGAPLHR